MNSGFPRQNKNKYCFCCGVFTLIFKRPGNHEAGNHTRLARQNLAQQFEKRKPNVFCMSSLCTVQLDNDNVSHVKEENFLSAEEDNVSSKSVTGVLYH